VEALTNFRARLADYRPTGELRLEDQPPCEAFATDDMGVTITWRDARGEDRLAYNFGCDWETRRVMANALTTAPLLLNVAGLRIPELE
jgi:hypothetical protein